jgi:polyhydroxyalkanoate synthase
MPDNNKYQEYFDQYNAYSKIHDLGTKYLLSGTEVVKTAYYRLRHYPKTGGLNQVFLIVPSIFNSPEILFLARGESFVENLQKYGEVFLIDWLEVEEPKYLLDDYVSKVVEVINLLKQKNISALSLIGHCIGGSLSIAASLIRPEAIKTITLLTCPWDFSHFFYVRKLQQCYWLDDYVEKLPQIPKIHIQILFFLLFPDYFSVKLDKFFSLTNSAEQDLAFRIENWLMSGNNIPKATYYQLMHKILDNNMLANLNWQINDLTIDPGLIDKPVYIVVANNDQIAPRLSILPLQRLLKNSTIIETEGGHISYLINNKLVNLFKE